MSYQIWIGGTEPSKELEGYLVLHKIHFIMQSAGSLCLSTHDTIPISRAQMS